MRKRSVIRSRRCRQMRGTTYSRASSGNVCWISAQSRRWMYGFDSLNCRRQVRRANAHNMFGVGPVFAPSVNDHVDMVLSHRSRGLARTSLAKSVLDAGGSQLRSRLRYKAIRHGAECVEVDEQSTPQVRSAYGARGGPKGREDLVARDWICGGWGVWHDRDINSAINILVPGRTSASGGRKSPPAREGKTLRLQELERVRPLTVAQSRNAPEHA